MPPKKKTAAIDASVPKIAYQRFLPLTHHNPMASGNNVAPAAPAPTAGLQAPPNGSGTAVTYPLAYWMPPGDPAIKSLADWQASGYAADVSQVSSCAVMASAPRGARFVPWKPSWPA